MGIQLGASLHASAGLHHLRGKDRAGGLALLSVLDELLERQDRGQHVINHE